MVETIGNDYYSIFIFYPNIQILPAVSTTGYGIINISSQWLKPLAMIIILFLFFTLISKYCPRFQLRDTDCEIIALQRLKPLAMFIILFLFIHNIQILPAVSTAGHELCNYGASNG